MYKPLQIADMWQSTQRGWSWHDHRCRPDWLWYWNGGLMFVATCNTWNTVLAVCSTLFVTEGASSLVHFNCVKHILFLLFVLVIAWKVKHSKNVFHVYVFIFITFSFTYSWGESIVITVGSWWKGKTSLKWFRHPEWSTNSIIPNKHYTQFSSFHSTGPPIQCMKTTTKLPVCNGYHAKLVTRDVYQVKKTN